MTLLVSGVLVSGVNLTLLLSGVLVSGVLLSSVNLTLLVSISFFGPAGAGAPQDVVRLDQGAGLRGPAHPHGERSRRPSLWCGTMKKRYGHEKQVSFITHECSRRPSLSCAGGEGGGGGLGLVGLLILMVPRTHACTHASHTRRQTHTPIVWAWWVCCGQCSPMRVSFMSRLRPCVVTHTHARITQTRAQAQVQIQTDRHTDRHRHRQRHRHAQTRTNTQHTRSSHLSEGFVGMLILTCTSCIYDIFMCSIAHRAHIYVFHIV